MLPTLIMLMAITGCIDYREDLNRKRADSAENNRTARRITESGHVEFVLWKQLTVGDIIKVHNRDLIPADMVLLESSDENGICFVMTSNLDGESNLKLRQVGTGMNKQLHGHGGLVKCEMPNNRLGIFEGTYFSTLGTRASLSNANVLLRGTQLRNTTYVRGVIIFVGACRAI